MKKKECFKCGEIKLLSEFYKHPKMADGHVNKCKECNKSDVQKNYRKNIEYYKEYDLNRNKREDRRESKTISCRVWRKKNPEKYAAHRVVSNALRDNKITKEPCVVCGREDSHAHHEDYTKPLDVIWLCPQCHIDKHKKAEEEE